MVLGKRESYINYAQQVDPEAKVTTNPAIANANTSYASILLFLQNNPAQSAKFITDLKDKFFTESCTVKNNIDFNNIAQLPNGAPFS